MEYSLQTERWMQKEKTSPILWLILIILCSTCFLSTPCGSTLLLIADEWFLQSMGAPGDEQIPILTWGICVPDSLHYVQFILVDMNMMPGVCLWACTEAFQSGTWWEPSLQGTCPAADSGHSDRAEPRMGCWAGVTSANKSLFHAAAAGCVWFTLWWTSERDLWTCKAVHRPQFHSWHSTRRPELCTELWTRGVSAPNGRPATFVRRYKKLHAYREVIFCLYPNQSQHLARENRVIKLLTVGFKILFTLQKVQKIKKIL